MSYTLWRRPHSHAAWIAIEDGYGSEAEALRLVRQLGLTGQFVATRSGPLYWPDWGTEPQIVQSPRRPKQEHTPSPTDRARIFSVAQRAR